MKKLVLVMTALLLSAGTTFAADNSLVGTYVLKMQDVYFVTKIDVKADGSYNYQQQTVDAQIPAPGCVGKWALSKSNVFTGTLDCSKFGVPQTINQQIDLSKVDMAALAKGQSVKVTVVSSLIGAPLQMTMAKTIK